MNHKETLGINFKWEEFPLKYAAHLIRRKSNVFPKQLKELFFNLLPLLQKIFILFGRKYERNKLFTREDENVYHEKNMRNLCYIFY